MKKILLLVSMVAFTFALNVNLYTCGASVVGNEVTFDVCMDSDDAVGGIQFTFDGGDSGLALTGASGGLAGDAGFTVSTSATGTVLGFSFTGASINASAGDVLVSLTGTFTDGFNTITNVGPTMGASDAFSTPGATPGTVTTESSQWDGASTLDGSSALPSSYSLKEAYPNPFNPTTTIDYTLRENGNVSIIVYDLMGREVKELVNEFQFADGGNVHSVVWNGTDNSGNSVASGIYLYKMVSNDFTKSHRITLMK